VRPQEAVSKRCCWSLLKEVRIGCPLGGGGGGGKKKTAWENNYWGGTFATKRTFRGARSRKRWGGGEVIKRGAGGGLPKLGTEGFTLQKGKRVAKGEGGKTNRPQAPT